MQDTSNEMQNQLATANARAAELIALAESRFGQMCSLWEYRGVIFRDHPPHLYYSPDDASVQISLSFKSIEDDLQRDFQLAHEVCHLLYPSVDPARPVSPRTIVINEGISTYFSVLVVAAFHGEAAARAVLQDLAAHSAKYFCAFELISALMEIDDEAIKKIRAVQPMINSVTQSDLGAADIILPDETIRALVAAF